MDDRHRRDAENLNKRELDRMVMDSKLHKIVGTLVLVEDVPGLTLTDSDAVWLHSCGVLS